MRGRQLYQKQDENGIATGHYIQFIQSDSKTILNQGMFGFLILIKNFYEYKLHEYKLND